MKVLSKIDRFGQIPRLNFQGNPLASTFIGAMLSICGIVLLAVVFSILVSTSVDSPTTTSFLSPLSFIEELDLVEGDFKFCVVHLYDDYLPDGTITSATAADLQNIFEQQLQTKVSAYITTEANEKINKQFTYCPDRSTSPVTHCICLNEESLKITASDVFHVKLDFGALRVNRHFDFSLIASVTALIPNTLKDPFLTDVKTYKLPTVYANFASLGVTFDKLIYNIDANSFISAPKTTYSVLPKTVTNDIDSTEQLLMIQGWNLSFSGQTITSDTIATKILDILAQVMALNGVFVMVFSILFFSFFKLKYTENLLNGVHSHTTEHAKGPQGKKQSTKISDFWLEDIELQDNSPKKRAQTVVRQKSSNKKPLYLGLREWLYPSSTKAAKVKTLQENDVVMKKYCDAVSLVRTKMEVEVIKKVLFSSDQLYMFDNIPFESFALGQTAAPSTKVKSVIDPWESLRSQAAKEDIQSRFIELMKKYYE